MPNTRLSACLPALFCLLVAPAFVAGCSGSDASVADVPSEEDEIVKSVRLEELAKSSALRTKVEAQNSEWGDDNIMNGGVDVMARKVAPATLASLDKVAKAALIDRMRADEAKLRGSITTSKPSGAAVTEAAKVIAIDGFFFSDSKENKAPVEAAVKKLVAALGSAADLDVAVAKAKVIPSFDDQSQLRATAYVFANKKTGELVIFYAREATG
jgi:hypothetical protein